MIVFTTFLSLKVQLLVNKLINILNWGVIPLDTMGIVQDIIDLSQAWAAYLSCCLPLTRPEFSDGFKRSFYSGLPLYKEHFSKILQHGWYWYIPIVDEIIKASTQEDVMDIKEITFQTTEDDPKESKTMMLSYNVRYKLINIYKAYMSVKDY